jgi:hypothetical protein
MGEIEEFARVQAESYREPEEMSQLQLRVAAEDPGEILRLQARRRGDRLDRPARQLDQGADQPRQPANFLLIGIVHTKKYIRFPRRARRRASEDDGPESRDEASRRKMGSPERRCGSKSQDDGPGRKMAAPEARMALREERCALGKLKKQPGNQDDRPDGKNGGRETKKRGGEANSPASWSHARFPENFPGHLRPGAAGKKTGTSATSGTTDPLVSLSSLRSLVLFSFPRSPARGPAPANPSGTPPADG